jgi:hypothetical protein
VPFVVLALLGGAAPGLGAPSARGATPELVSADDVPAGMALW